MKDKPTYHIYLANGLFSEADRMYNELLAKEIEKLGKFYLYVPQRNDAINDKSKCASSIEIYNGDRNELLSSDILIAVIDGQSCDTGVAAEIGWMAAWAEADSPNRKILALFTDVREGSQTFSLDKMKALHDSPVESQFPYVNLFIIGAIKSHGEIFTSRKDLINYLKAL